MPTSGMWLALPRALYLSQPRRPRFHHKSGLRWATEAVQAYLIMFVAVNTKQKWEELQEIYKKKKNSAWLSGDPKAKAKSLLLKAFVAHGVPFALLDDVDDEDFKNAWRLIRASASAKEVSSRQKHSHRMYGPAHALQLFVKQLQATEKITKKKINIVCGTSPTDLWLGSC